MKLLRNEKILISSGNQLVLTNYRIVQNDEVFGKSYRIDIFLENISTVESHYKSSPIFLLLAAIALIVGVGLQKNDSLVAGIILAIVFVAIWGLTRKHLITITSNGGNSMDIFIESMSNKKVNDFIFIIHDAMLNRINYLYSKDN